MKIIIAILILGLIIMFHELGHFLLAKWNGITVTEFSIGMGPRLLTTVKGGTRYSLKALPLGGSCMMLGEDGELDTEGSFNNSSVGARIAVILAGPIFNFILAFLGAVILMGTMGVDRPVITEVKENSSAAEAGLQPGDEITKFNGRRIKLSRDLLVWIELNGVPSGEITLEVKRNGEKKEFSITPEKVSKYMLGYSYYPDEETPEIVSLTKGQGMEQSGIKVGDIITGINGEPIENTEDLMEYWKEHPITDETPIQIQYERDGLDYEASVVPTLTHSMDMGFTYNTAREKVSSIATIQYSFYEIRYQIRTVLDSFKLLFTGQLGLNDMAGPVGVVEVIGNTYESAKEEGVLVTIMTLINMMILLSANLGVMNLLPIPALDGGRFLFLLVELVRGKPVNREAEGMIHFAGLVLLMILMVVIMFNDIRRIF